LETRVVSGIEADAGARARQAREEAARDRRRARQDRDAGAGDRVSAERDRTTATADRAAGAGERVSAELDRTAASGDRDAGAMERTSAGLDRSTSSSDRDAGAGERSSAEVDRSTASADRDASAAEREHSSLDELTGAYLRGPGLLELSREMARAKRSGHSLVFAFIDVDGLKAVNDRLGHAAGDRTLYEVANALRANVRSYDVLVRYGGDEFLCVLVDQTISIAAERFALVNASLAASAVPATVTIGIAQLRPDESLDSVIQRADAELYRNRRQQRPT
jgi:diguanylate cyclase (GGDEF)-like protein